MKLIKHNAIENFSTFNKYEKEDLIIQELSKAFLLYPRATADILDTCGIKYKSIKSQDLALAVESNANNLKMINRIVRLAFLVNQKGETKLKAHDRNISYRNVMRTGKSFLDSNKENMKEATLLTRDMMKQKIFSKILKKQVEQYENLDGEEQQKIITEKNDSQPSETKSNKKWIWIGLSATLLVGLGVYLYIRLKKNNAE